MIVNRVVIVGFIESILKPIREWGMIVNGSEVGINGGERESEFSSQCWCNLGIISKTYIVSRCSFPTQVTTHFNTDLIICWA